MQQLNVLPINVSKSIETKDEPVMVTSTSSKDDFSQHIDMHLTKNKGDGRSIKSDIENKVNENRVKSGHEKSMLKPDDKVQGSEQNSEKTLVAPEETDSANNTQEVAAAGKKTDNERIKEKSSEDVSELNESELLMSFLIKADKTLVDANATEITVDQKAKALVKGEENNRLQGNDLKDNNLLKASIETNSNAASGDLSAEKNSVDSDVENNKLTELTVKEIIQNLGNHDFVNKTSSQANENKDIERNNDTAQKEMAKQLLTSEINMNSDELNKIKLTSALNVNAQASDSTQSSLEIEARIKDQLAQLMQSEKGITKRDENIAATTSVTQSSHNKNVSSANITQASAETAMKEGDLVEPEEQLNAKAVEHLIEQSKDLGVGKNSDASNNVVTKTTAGFSVNNNVIEMTDKAAQSTQDIEEQHAIELFNPMGKAEISQNQKTNTQLHQETISIFRRDFAEAVKDKVMLIISQKLQQFEITLDPPEFGNMQVRVNLQGEQASVNFVVQNQQAKEAFEQNMHKLKELLAEQGVDVGDANVEQQSQQSDNDANNNEQYIDNEHHDSITNTADASDAIEHNLSAKMINTSATAVDYYA